jgi:uncharacterized protein YqcC (DUF446 family)
LVDLEAELRRTRLWEAESPAPEALLSKQPFCYDTLSFPQWLQFVFLPRMYGLVKEEGMLPQQCGIAPMAEQYLRGLPVAGSELVAVLLKLDGLLSGK